MRIGQIVFIKASNLPSLDTGIIIRKERDEDAQCMWYEVLCNDGQNHVIPDYLLSLARATHPILDKNKVKNFANKAAKFMQACTKTAHT